MVKSFPALRNLSITDGSGVTDEDLKTVAGIPQLESLTMDKLPLPDERIPVLSAFSHLKTITLALRPQGYSDETQAKVKALLPKVELKFVK